MEEDAPLRFTPSVGSDNKSEKKTAKSAALGENQKTPEVIVEDDSRAEEEEMEEQAAEVSEEEKEFISEMRKSESLEENIYKSPVELTLTSKDTGEVIGQEDETVDGGNEEISESKEGDRETEKGPLISEGAGKAEIQGIASENAIDSISIKDESGVPKVIIILILIFAVVVIAIVALFVKTLVPEVSDLAHNGNSTTGSIENGDEEKQPLVSVDIPLDTDALADSLKDLDDAIADIDITSGLIDENLNFNDEAPEL